MTKGSISTEKTVWCGGEDCGNWNTVSQNDIRGTPREIWRRAGWINTRYRGWLCPHCKKKLEV